MENDSKNDYLSISHWIEKIIDSCDSSIREQEKICDHLITNFTNKILFVNNDFKSYIRIERKLRKKLLSKFYN